MQLNAVVFDEEKDALIKQRDQNQNQIRMKFGRGEIYFTSLVNKILCLIVNKLASLDPSGVGVEMEAGKPNWYDALNGLPGLLGSSISETLEIKRHILFVLETFQLPGVAKKSWPIFEEMKDFMAALHDLLSSQVSAFDFWEASTTAKEHYREKTRLGISGKEKKLTAEEVEAFLKLGLKKIDKGIKLAWDKKTNILLTYFINNVTEYQITEASKSNEEQKVKSDVRKMPCFRANKFKQTPMPLFLEGPVHYLRCKPDRKKARALVENIKKSDLYDHQLNMYKVNASLADQPMEIGRARVFSPGWFENESIWLHMQYKYLLELLRNELYPEFYQDLKKVLVPFMKPEVYGRSVLENSSFIVSSANPDPSIHGNGFVARLTGATAEFIHMLMLMTVGQKPFSINRDGELQLRFTPALAAWLFTKDARKNRVYLGGQWQEVAFSANTFSFMFLGSILVTYHNRSCKDTFGAAAVSPVLWTVTDSGGKRQTFEGESLNGYIVEKIRQRKARRIEIDLA
jgi:hypothetical protein